MRNPGVIIVLSIAVIRSSIAETVNTHVVNNSAVVKKHDETKTGHNNTEHKFKLSNTIDDSVINRTYHSNKTSHDEVPRYKTEENPRKYDDDFDESDFDDNITYIYNADDEIKDESDDVSEYNERKKLELKKTYCERLNKKFSINRSNLKIAIYDKYYRIIVKSTERAPSRAAAAIIATVLKHGLGYSNVFIEIDNRTNCELATTLDAYFDKSDEIIIHVDAAWKGPEEKCPVLPRCPHNWTRTCSIAGPRLLVIGATPGVNVRLHAALRSNVNSTFCQNTYDQHNLEECGFLNISSNPIGCIPVLIPPDVIVPVELNLTNIDGISLCQYRLTNRSALSHILRPSKRKKNNTAKDSFQDMDNKSFFFIDYEFYSDNDIVKNVYLPIKYTSDITALRVADYKALHDFAPLIMDVLNNTTPESSELREIIDLNATLHDLEEATCAWANNNEKIFQDWNDYINIKPRIVTILCTEDSDYSEYLNIIIYMNSIVHLKSSVTFQLEYKRIKCSDKNELNRFIRDIMSSNDGQWLAGIVARGEGVEAGIDATKNSYSQIQMVLYDVPPSPLPLGSGTISSTGSQPMLSRAILHFFKQRGWHRIAIISEKTSLAKDFSATLTSDKTIRYLEKEIEKDDYGTNIDKVLADLKKADARILFVNSGSDTANLIACKAAALGMDIKSKYQWIAREWRPSKCRSNMRIVTISYGWRGRYPMPNGIGGNKNIYAKFESRFKGRVWPPLAISLADAILLTAHRLTVTILKEPHLLYDLHGREVTSTMDRLTKNNTGTGVMQSLELHNYTRANPYIYVNVWSGENITSLAIWRGTSNSQKIVEISKMSESVTNTFPKDGSSTSCITTSGERFSPSCDDAKWICGFSVVLLAMYAIWFTKRRLRKQIEKREQDALIRILTRCEKTASVLSSHIVKRSDLELHDELGYGHFGRVRLGLLRRANRNPTPIAAKALRKDAAPAEEAEFLREASTLACLSHTHIIGFVGVCADTDGPPLLLMEHAFFGDLLRYLRARRHLAETKYDEIVEVTADYRKCLEEEEFYVSEMELTRLAREAALALAYLNECRLVHRDVRAANCLIDTKRSLKLADYGMARRMGGNTQPENFGKESEPSSDYKYICRRRGVFPVPWMAPESLEKGEFSHASDVWALGVLILEVATLGARPFGLWRPLTVLRYVMNGKHPPLPIDASYRTTEVAKMCWANLPERVLAVDVYDYLRAHPTAIRPALRPERLELDITTHGSDSGFGDPHADLNWTKNLRVSTL